jgi:hypothetical protein
MDIPDNFSKSIETVFGCKTFKKITFFGADPDPGFGIFLTLVPGSGMEKFGSEKRSKNRTNAAGAM